MMICPNINCDSKKSRIYKSIPDKDSSVVYRWRKCSICGARWKTKETIIMWKLGKV